jgi:hypothetical protein
MKHFYVYPKIEYSNNIATNVMVRGKIRDAVLQNSALYYKYRIDEFMKPETLSYKYYGSPNYVWAIFYANNIVDPLTDWPMNQREFDKYILQKYGSMDRAQLKYSSNGALNHDSIHHYVLNEKHVIDETTFSQLNAILSKYKTYYQANDDMLKKGMSSLTIGNFVIDRQSFLSLGVLNPETVSAVTYYEHEYNENEKKRDIFVIDKEYVFQIVSEFENLFD